MFIAAQIFGLLVLISNVIAMQMKNKKQIILMFIFANFFSAINFLLLNSLSGAIICGFAIIQNFINEYFENKNKKVPLIIICLYIIVSILLGLVTYQKLIDIIPIICSIFYTIMILQTKEKNIRAISLVNIILWVIYDLCYMAYTAAISDSIATISTIIGIYRFDIRKDKEAK